tara:strand:- start:66688 stop:67782 length:1095 start_codon:yes stop_codon:yes gene_type:complete
MKQIILSVLALSIIACLSSCKNSNKTDVQANISVKSTFTNPLLPSGPDPWAIYHEGNYYYIKSGHGGITLMRTPDITDLKNAEKKVIWKAPSIGDHSRNIWAPEIHNIDGKWYVYVAADDGNNVNHRMFVLENTTKDPFEGEFVMKSRLKTDPEDNWAIDGSIFEHNNNLYFIWSGWEHPKDNTGETQNIYIAHMSNPWTIDSDRVLLSTPELEWERNYDYPDAWTPDAPIYVNEGPQMLQHGDKLHIIYSASGCWTPYYALGMLTTTVDSDIMDKASWIKYERPVFQQSTENGVYGTGHNSFFKSPDGTEDWILYHANDDPADGCGDKRSPRAQKITWTADDMPIMGVPFSTSVELEKPSGIK